jgi:hypothetical protein
MEIIDMQLEQFQLDLQGGGLAPIPSPANGSNINGGSPRDSLFQRK